MGRRSERDKRVRALAYFSPPAMVAAATARRLAGDWRGACAAARVDLHINPHDVATRYGTEAAARIAADLAGLAPDLLRRFLPRTETLALAPRASVVLSRRTGPLRPPAHHTSGRRVEPAVPVLVATLPRDGRAPQRIGLRVGEVGVLPERWYDLPDWCWHADAVQARRWAYGASETRLAWHTPDGLPYRPDEVATVRGPVAQVATVEGPVDRAAEVETIDGLLVLQRWPAACGAAGIAVDLSVVRARYGWDRWSESRLPRLGPTLPVLAAEARRLAGRYGRTTLCAADHTSAVDVADDGVVTVRRTRADDRSEGPDPFALPAPVEAALLSHGSLRPDDLHPLVHEALYPGRTQEWEVPPPVPAPPVRVRCGPDWHVVRVTGGRAFTAHHTEAELRREFLVAGLGGPIVGCATAVRAWRTGAKPAPKQIRLLRRDLFALAFHGDTDALLAVLAEGFDPALRDGDGCSLLHWLAHLDHTRMLPVLMAAGLVVDERDRHGNTPLHLAVRSGDREVMAALVAAGADPQAPDAWGRTPEDVFVHSRRTAGR
ncbi:ankyrin repeat domain-containing protein [Micromonospora sp. NPDC050417]|uniref:ankyrin repeat domain-containing protein n=1 Tax=Micromonospora sp. NPDC050417 TaxID=3364280 RepID=UPI00378817FE